MLQERERRGGRAKGKKKAKAHIRGACPGTWDSFFILLLFSLFYIYHIQYIVYYFTTNYLLFYLYQLILPCSLSFIVCIVHSFLVRHNVTLQEPIPVSPGLMPTIDDIGPFTVQRYPAYIQTLPLLSLTISRIQPSRERGENTGQVDTYASESHTNNVQKHGGADLQRSESHVRFMYDVRERLRRSNVRAMEEK